MKVAIVLLSVALVASVATALAGLWPNLRNDSNVSDRRERVRIADSFGNDILSSDFHVSRVKLDYLPGKALVEIVEDGHTNNVGVCVVLNENFGNRIERGDYDRAPCDF